MSQATASAELSTPPRRYSLAIFFCLAFGVSWAVWLPGTIAAVRSGDLSPPRSTGLDLLGSFGPLLAALVTTALMDGRAGYRDLLRRLLTWRVRVRWYAFVLFWPATLSLVATGVAVVLGAEAPAFNHPPVLDAYPADLTARIPWLALLPAVFLQQVLLGSSLGEEPGWRGYALPRMQWMHSSLSASLLLGLLWALWHLPLWIRPEQQLSQVAWDTLGIIAAAVLFTWVFNHSRGSLLLALLFHASIAVTGLFLAVPDRHAVISTVLAWLLVGLVLRLDRPSFDVAPPGN